VIAFDGTEVIGYAASALVVLSLTMRSILKLRLISLCGSVTFLVYGILIESTPIIITNLCIAAINVWFLRKEFVVRTSGSADLGVSLIRHDSPFLRDFVEYHIDDICHFQPDFSMPVGDDVVAMMLTREGLPAGLVVGHIADDTLHIDLDYVLREHRDSRLGTWLYGQGTQVFRSLGVRRLRADAVTEAHEKYLHRAGFEATAAAHPGELELVL
jgi:Acetyltransferase (GNAT) family